MGYVGSNDRYVPDSDEFFAEAERRSMLRRQRLVVTLSTKDHIRALQECFLALFNSLTDDQKVKAYDYLTGRQGD